MEPAEGRTRCRARTKRRSIENSLPRVSDFRRNQVAPEQLTSLIATRPSAARVVRQTAGRTDRLAHPGCESAPKPDPTSGRPQLLGILKEILFRVGSRSAPIGTPTSGVLADDFSDLVLFWPGSRFGSDLQNGPQVKATCGQNRRSKARCAMAALGSCAPTPLAETPQPSHRR